MTADPKVSVIIPAHNHAHFLRRTLNSVKGQTYDDYEVIVVDNGSTDNTREAIESFGWDRVRYFYQNDTGSAAGPRNTGIRASRGSFVAFLDSDDIWYRDKLERVMGLFKNDPDIGLVCNDEFVTKEGNVISRLRYGPYEKDMYEKLLFSGNRLSGSGTTVKKDFLLKAGCFDESRSFVHVEDYELWLRLARIGCRFFFLNEPLGEYTLHDKNLSYDVTTQMRNLRNVICAHYFKYEKRHHPGYACMFIRAFARSYYTQLLRYKNREKNV